MKKVLANKRNNMLRLLRFLFWYAAAVAAVFYLMPIVALYLQGQYETLSSAVKLLALLGFFAAVGAWQFVNWRRRHREAWRK